MIRILLTTGGVWVGVDEVVEVLEVCDFTLDFRKVVGL